MSVRLDETDKRILRILQENAKTPYSKIAKMLKVSEATIHIRVKKLRERGVIRGFRADVDPEKVGKGTTAFVLVKADPKKYSQVLGELSKIKDVYELYDVTGEYYALAKIRVGTREELTKVLDKIGDIDGIVSTYTMFVLRILKEEKVVDI